MLPQNKDLILKEKVKLYDNIARIDNYEGRLLAELQIHPTPRIIWEFEMLGNANCSISRIDNLNKPLNSLSGYFFSIKEPYLHGISDGLGIRHALNGFSSQALYGNIEAPAHKFTFYLPNARFQKESLQYRLCKVVKETDTDRQIEQGVEGKYVYLTWDDTWSIRLEVRNESLSWLDKQNHNIGILITTVGCLYQPKYNATKPETFAGLQTITLSKALERLEDFSLFLSYANGGYTAPLYVEGYHYKQLGYPPIELSSAVALVLNITLLEQLGSSWVTSSSDLRNYMRCLPTFKRMMQSQFWEETFEFVLIQYFQATQSRISWPVAATAVGAALERLSYTILVEDESDTQKKSDNSLLFEVKKNKKIDEVWNLDKYKKKDGSSLSSAGKRLSLLVERIGLVEDVDPDILQSFLNVRNDAVHPRTSNMTNEERWNYISKATQWIDEVLLWRLGYNGEYFDRINCSVSTTPRYNLNTRNPNW